MRTIHTRKPQTLQGGAREAAHLRDEVQQHQRGEEAQADALLLQPGAGAGGGTALPVAQEVQVHICQPAHLRQLALGWKCAAVSSHQDSS